MKAASAAGRLRARRFERECERLRPLGEAYALRRFGSELSRADAEDVVAEVLIRLHERAGRGIGADNLRALFLTSVHNASIDLLRARAARPQTVELDAAAAMPEAGPALAERAESRDNVVRLQEALARMRAGYRETILLRYGLGLKVPEIADHFGISGPAAKKRVLRAVDQVHKRMAQLEGEEFCPQMRELARGFALEGEAAGLASEGEEEILRAHFAHCGACRSYLVRLRAELHELGSGALAALLGGERISGRLDLPHGLGHLAGGVAEAAQGALDRLRHLALRGAAPLSSGEGPAGAVMGTGQKIAALCGVGAAATATCVLSGAVGPGIGAVTPHPEAPPRPAAKVKRLASGEVPSSSLLGAPEGTAGETPGAPQAEGANGRGDAEGGSPQSAPPSVSEGAEPPSGETAEEAPPSEFGIESSSGSGYRSRPSGGEASAEAPPATSSPSEGEGGGEFGGSAAGGSGESSSGGSKSQSSGGSVGFQG